MNCGIQGETKRRQPLRVNIASSFLGSHGLLAAVSEFAGSLLAVYLLITQQSRIVSWY